MFDWVTDVIHCEESLIHYCGSFFEDLSVGTNFFTESVQSTTVPHRSASVIEIEVEIAIISNALLENDDKPGTSTSL